MERGKKMEMLGEDKVIKEELGAVDGGHDYEEQEKKASDLEYEAENQNSSGSFTAGLLFSEAGQIYEKLGNKGKALEAFRKAAKRFEESGEYSKAIYYYEISGDGEGAKAVKEKVILKKEQEATSSTGEKLGKIIRELSTVGVYFNSGWQHLWMLMEDGVIYRMQTGINHAGSTRAERISDKDVKKRHEQKHGKIIEEWDDRLQYDYGDYAEPEWVSKKKLELILLTLKNSGFNSVDDFVKFAEIVSRYGIKLSARTWIFPSGDSGLMGKKDEEMRQELIRVDSDLLGWIRMLFDKTYANINSYYIDDSIFEFGEKALAKLKKDLESSGLEYITLQI